MIEMRWKMVDADSFDITSPGRVWVHGEHCPHPCKLQYRHRPYLPPMHDMGDGVIVETVWSEWQDAAPPSVSV